jgi:hypothetical protein
MSRRDDLLRDYRAAFLRFLPRSSEAALHTGHELGRAAVQDGLSILELVQVHHDVLAEVLRSSGPEDVTKIVAAASEFLLEVLGTHDMTQRRILDPS